MIWWFASIGGYHKVSSGRRRVTHSRRRAITASLFALCEKTAENNNTTENRLPLPSEMCGQKTTNTQKYLTAALHHRTHTHTHRHRRACTHTREIFPPQTTAIQMGGEGRRGRRITETEISGLWQLQTTTYLQQEHDRNINSPFTSSHSQMCSLLFAFLSSPMNFRSMRRTTNWLGVLTTFP